MTLLSAISVISKTTAGTGGPTFWLPEQASTVAPEIDFVFNFITWLCYFFFAVVVILMLIFCVKYRRTEHAANVTGPVHNTALEVTWTTAPLLLVVAIFWVGMQGFLNLRNAPDNSYDILVTGQKWSWTFMHPESGVIESAELHVPVNRPVRFIMQSQDVLHAAYIPAFRVKQDVVPGRKSTLWFEATKIGEYDFFCAEYCGTDHSNMYARVSVLSKEAFDDFIENEKTIFDRMTEEELPGYALNRLYNRCKSCHTLDGTALVGPSFKGLWDRTESGSTVFTNGQTLANLREPGAEYELPDNYIVDSILNPSKYIVENYTNAMPSMQGQLKPRQIDALILMLQNLDQLVDDDGNPLDTGADAN